jgi:uncharacterized protein
MAEGKCIACKIAGLLVIIGALNWGAIAFFETDLVVKVLGPTSGALKYVYGVIGVAAVLKLLNFFGLKCPACKGACSK